MVTRLIGLLLGLALAGYGYGAIEPQGFTAPYLPSVDLGPFAAFTMQIAWFALVFGLVLAIAAVFPRSRSRGRKTSQAAAFTAYEEAEAAPSMMSAAAQPRPLW